jgi:putative spermidine/putrescine transport system permease protein
VSQSVISAIDGTPLKLKLRRAERRSRLRSLGLVLPLLAFILVTFALPIGKMLFLSVDNPLVHRYLAATLETLAGWDGRETPGEASFAALATDLTRARADGVLGQIGTRLNYDLPGFRSLMNRIERHLDEMKPPFRDAFIAVDAQWGRPEIWRVIKRDGVRYTLAYYVAALDLRYLPDGSIGLQPEAQRIYVTLFLRTLWVSLLITIICAALAYPVAYLLAHLPTRRSSLLMILVLLPFWTSLLVRTTAWIVLLQGNGVINDILVGLGIIDDANRLNLIYNMTGTIIAMVHVLLPFMVLPLFSVMKTVSPTHVRAAKSLGANPVLAFWRVYAPQTVPGLRAGSILVFILAVGYYITPALIGGRTGQLISNFIAYHVQSSLNWGLAAALGSILLGGVLLLYFLYNRLVGVDDLKLG